MLHWDLVIKQPAPRRILGGGGIYNFKARFKWAILKIKAKMTLHQFFWPYLPKLLSNFSSAYSSGPPLSIYDLLDAFWRYWSVGGRRFLALLEPKG